MSFFLSSGAAATLIGKSPTWVPVVLATFTAIITAYAMAGNLDGRIATMAKLHSSWNRLAGDYDRLWNHAYDDDSEETLEDIIARETDASELAVTNAPNNKKLLEQWQQHVFESHQLPTNNSAALHSLRVGDQPKQIS